MNATDPQKKAETPPSANADGTFANADGTFAHERTAWRRYVPLGIVAVLVGLVLTFGPESFVNFDAIALRYAGMTAWVAAHPFIAALGAVLVYLAVTAVSFPAAWLVTVAYGLVFGWALATLYVVTGATLGAVLLYFIAQLALADFFRARAGGVLNRMAKGFREDAVSYLLFLRLAPIFPFTLVNVVPAVLGVSFWTFLWTTAVGIVPGTFAYAYAGEGLRSIVGERARACAQNVAPCGTPLHPSDLVTQQVLIAFIVVAIVSLLPVMLKRLRAQRAVS